MAYWTRRNTLKNGVGLLLLPAFLIMFFRWFEQSQIYHPSAQHVRQATEVGSSFEEVTLQSEKGISLHSWFFAAPAGSPRARQVVLVCHGNGGNISYGLDQAALLLQSGLNVMVFDYRGYGRSTGRPSEEGTYRDAQAAYAWLRLKGFEPAQIVVLGESLGGAIATELARREKVGALILQSTFTSILDIGSEFFPWLPVRWLASIHYDTHGKLPQLTVPVLILHSRGDNLIGFAHAEKNFAVAREPKLFWEIKGGHNDALHTDLLLYRRGIDTFLEQHLRPQ